MSYHKQFTLYTHLGGGPNGWKVMIVLEELGLEYEPRYLDFNKGEHRATEHTQYNPNGRIPTLIDHSNNNFVVWESNAIIVYLVEKYDPEHKISVTEDSKKFQQLQWLLFQASGQGPYFGQAFWFMKYHNEVIPSAIERYRKETIRILSVLESVLAKQEWLVGERCTIADMSFIPWNIAAFDTERRWTIPQFVIILEDYPGFSLPRDYPAVHRWHSAMLGKKSVVDILTARHTMMEQIAKLTHS